MTSLRRDEQKQRRDGTNLRTDTLSRCLLKVLLFIEWRFDNAWNLGLGRHYLG
ncbi:rpoE leader peptide RseD [Enterobacter bugandensis]|uniref:rpoE leader peptide RseD n=1 Tax=Enterobacter sp. TaxID=42895 RepID=UPI0031E37CF7